MSESVGSIHYDLSLDKSKFDKASREVFDNVGNLAKKFVAATAVMAGAAVAFGVSAVKSFQASEEASSQLQAVLKSTGGVAGVTADQANDLAKSFQKVTKFSDEAVLGGENLLLTFTNIGKDIFPQATETMLDMSQALGQDVKSSAIQLGKALQDPILGVTALRRVGVNFTEKQQDVIAKLVETGKAAEAQALILKELQVEFGGSAKAAGTTFAGKMEILKNSFDDVKESIGQTIVTALIPLGERLSTFVASDQFQAWLVRLQEWLAIHIPMAINWITNTGIPAMVTVFQTLYPIVQTALDVFMSLVNFLKDNQWVFWAVVTVFGAIKTAMFLNGALVAFQGVMMGVRGAIAVTSTAMAGFQALVAIPLIMPAIAVGAALLSIGMVYNAWENLKSLQNEINRQQTSMGAGTTSFYASLQRGVAEGRFSQVEASRRMIEYNKNFQSFKAMGGSVDANRPYVVGERGPEMFVPRSAGSIMTNKDLSGVGGSTNIYGDINIADKSTADYFFSKLSRNQELSMRGLSTMAGTVG